MLGRKASPLHGGVRLEDHEHLVAGGADRMRHFAAAKPAEHLRVGGVTVVKHYVIVGALLGMKKVSFSFREDLFLDSPIRNYRTYPSLSFPCPCRILVIIE